MWVKSPIKDNQFRDIMINKIENYIKFKSISVIDITNTKHKYLFLPNHDYNYDHIEKELLYIMNHTKENVTPYPTTHFSTDIPRIQVLLMCLYNMTYDAIYIIPSKKTPRVTYTKRLVINKYTDIIIKILSIIGFFIISIRPYSINIKIIIFFLLIIAWII